ncbi:MAG TPA: hypothetical protein VKP13_05430 [Nitrospira sp.]|nr:hypothetical protein [Nitrospira sp.]
MAARWDGFNALEGSRLPHGQLGHSAQRPLRLHSLHVIGESAEGRIVPADVGGIGPSMAQSSEPGHVDVRNPRALQREW